MAAATPLSTGSAELNSGSDAALHFVFLPRGRCHKAIPEISQRLEHFLSVLRNPAAALIHPAGGQRSPHVLSHHTYISKMSSPSRLPDPSLKKTALGPTANALDRAQDTLKKEIKL